MRYAWICLAALGCGDNSFGGKGTPEQIIASAKDGQQVEVTGEVFGVSWDSTQALARKKLLGELTAHAWQYHGILQTMEDRRVHWSELIEAAFPIGIALFDPFPRQRPILVDGVIVPRHPAGIMPSFSPIGRNFPGSDANRIECRGDKNELFNRRAFLGHHPGDPATD